MAVYKTHGTAEEGNVMACVSNLAISYKELGEHDKAEEMYKKVSGARLEVGAPVRACVPPCWLWRLVVQGGGTLLPLLGSRLFVCCWGGCSVSRSPIDVPSGR